jgi:two-component system response regulator YesN
MLKQATGDSFVSYLNKIRIERAKELLVTTELSSNEISSAVGYRYPQNFIRNFQKYAGMTPGNYRALHRDEQS